MAGLLIEARCPLARPCLWCVRGLVLRPVRAVRLSVSWRFALLLVWGAISRRPRRAGLVLSGARHALVKIAVWPPPNRGQGGPGSQNDLADAAARRRGRQDFCPTQDLPLRAKVRLPCNQRPTVGGAKITEEVVAAHGSRVTRFTKNENPRQASNTSSLVILGATMTPTAADRCRCLFTFLRRDHARKPWGDEEWPC